MYPVLHHSTDFILFESILRCFVFTVLLKNQLDGASSVAFESQHDKTSKITQAPSEDQPKHLIRVFAVRMKKHWVLSYPLSAQRRF